MMTPKQRLWLSAVLLVFVVGFFVWLSQAHPQETVIDKSYYTGPRLNHKTGNWTTVDGKIVSPPPGTEKTLPVTLPSPKKTE